VECRVVATGNSVDGVWSQLLKGYTRPKVQLFSQQVNTGCGPATTDVGPFYCPIDQTAYFDTSFFHVLVDQFGSSGGPLAQEYVVAHEFGHHVQDLLGVLGRAQQGPGGSEGNGVRTELQADCYAGVWAHYAAITKQEGTGVTFLKPLSDKDIADALSAASSVGDDRIQQSSTGRVNPESWTHGSSAERQKWFTTGYQTGDPNKCDTFSADALG
jgi:predicted metalloprotease